MCQATSTLGGSSRSLIGLMLIALGALLLPSCSWVGSDLAEGARPKVRPIAREAVTGAREVLAEPETERALVALEAALIKDARDGLIGEDTKQKLQGLIDESLQTLKAGGLDTEEALGDKLAQKVGKVREQVLGQATQKRLDEMREDLLGEETRLKVETLLDGALSPERIDRVRDRFLGEPLRASVNLLVSGAVTSAADAASSKLPQVLSKLLDPLTERLHVEEARASRYAWLCVLAVVCIVIAIVVAVYLVRRDRRTLRVITRQIDDLQNEGLKESIQKAADDAGVEQHLHSLVKANRESRRAAPAPRAAA